MCTTVLFQFVAIFIDQLWTSSSAKLLHHSLHCPMLMIEWRMLGLYFLTLLLFLFSHHTKLTHWLRRATFTLLAPTPQPCRHPLPSGHDPENREMLPKEKELTSSLGRFRKNKLTKYERMDWKWNYKKITLRNAETFVQDVCEGVLESKNNNCITRLEKCLYFRERVTKHCYHMWINTV